MRSDASTEQQRAKVRTFHAQRRETHGYTSVNIPPDVRDGLAQVKRTMRERLGIPFTTADTLRYLVKMFTDEEEMN